MQKKIIVLILLLISIITLSACSSKQEKFIGEYINAWEELDYKKMYSMLSIEDKENVQEEEFRAIFNDAYEILDVEELNIEINEDKESQEDIVPIKVNLKGSIVDTEFDLDLKLVSQEEDNKDEIGINWEHAHIYPSMEEGDRFVHSRILPKRGEILDRNDQKLAYNGTLIQVGIVPGRLGAQKEEIVEELADTFSLSKQYILDRLELSWVQDDSFVDLVKVSEEDLPLIQEIYEKSSGATYKEIDDRVYPYKELAAHLTGYLGFINEEELDSLEEKGFTANDKIGKTGLERVFDEQLRGVPGSKISLIAKDGKEKEMIYEEGVEDGDDLKLTIDIELQKSLYEEIKDEAGTAATMEYKTGEVLALVSAPSYDPNDFILGIDANQLASLQEAEDRPLLNRFTSTYVPGSVFKPITAAIALDEEILDKNFSININGYQWQKDSSWGNYYITRVSDPGTSVDLNKAMVYSDNIYFAHMALEIGTDKFVERAKDFGIGESLNLRYDTSISQMGNNQAISSEILLADSGYGQGEVLLSILNIPKAYSTFANKGRVVEPKLILDDEEAIAERIISEEVADIVLDTMINVVEDSSGTGKNARINGKKIAGKTGTAELKITEDSHEQGELGWFSAIDISDETPYITTMLIENVQGRGGSSVALNKVRQFIDNY